MARDRIPIKLLQEVRGAAKRLNLLLVERKDQAGSEGFCWDLFLGNGHYIGQIVVLRETGQWHANYHRLHGEGHDSAESCLTAILDNSRQLGVLVEVELDVPLESDQDQLAIKEALYKLVEARQ